MRKIFLIVSLLCFAIAANESERRLVVSPSVFPHDRFWAWGNSGWNNPESNYEPRYWSSVDENGIQNSGATSRQGWSEIKDNSYTTHIKLTLTRPVNAKGNLYIPWLIERIPNEIELFAENRNSRNTSANILITGTLRTIDGIEYITGNIRFNPSGNISDSIRVRIIDHNTYHLPLNIVVKFGEPEYSSQITDDIEVFLYPQTITIISDDPPPVETKWAAIFDTTGNGYPDIIRAEIENVGSLDNTTTEFYWRWGATEKSLIPRGNISRNGNNFTFDIRNFNSRDGAADNGRLFVETARENIETEIIDSVGPAIVKADYFPNARHNRLELDTLEIRFSEDVILRYISDCDGGGNPQMPQFILAFARDTSDRNDSTSLIVRGYSVDRETGLWRFFYRFSDITDANGRLDYSYVKIVYNGDAMLASGPTGIIDRPFNQPLSYNNWVSISDHWEPMLEPRYIEFNVKSAAYFNRIVPADGYVDLIRVEFEINSDINSDVSEEMIKKIAEKGFLFPECRMFNEISDIKVIGNIIEISISQNKDRIAAKTSVSGEMLAVNTTIYISDTLGISASGTIPILDSIAPIITRGLFLPMQIKNESDEIIDTLTVYFSERVSCAVAKEAIRAWSVSKNTDYGFEFETRQVNANSVTLLVKGDMLAVLPRNGDYIRIDGNFGIIDSAGVRQEVKTIWAPLEVGRYRQNYVISIYPNPYAPVGNKSKTNPVIEKWGNPDEANKMAVIVKPIGKRVEVLQLSGNIRVIDAVGNIVVEKESFEQGRIGDGAIIWTWDAKNTRKRNVGAGAYYAIIEITDETQSETQTVLRKIGIKN